MAKMLRRTKNSSAGTAFLTMAFSIAVAARSVNLASRASVSAGHAH
jgi:hypothetical protein